MVQYDMAKNEKAPRRHDGRGEARFRRLTVKCTQCHQVSELYLSTDAHIVIFTCPSCLTPIMYFRQRIFVLTQEQMNKIKDGGQQTSISRLIRSIVSRGAREKAEDVVRRLQREVCLQSVAVKEERPVISRDEITDLRIMLATCSDSREFIESL